MKITELRPLNGAWGRWRREARRRLLEPILVGNRSFRETVLNALAAKGNLVFCDLPEGKFFVDPSDRVIGTHLMWRGNWQLSEFRQAVGILRKEGRLGDSSVFVDVGANIGTHTVYALGGGFARAVSFEPAPANLRLLRMNIEVNGLTDRCTVLPIAVGAQGGQATLHLHPRNKGAHSLARVPSTDGLNAVEVAVERLDDALARVGVADDLGLISIDVEGHEPDAIEGLGELLGRVPLMIEYAPQRYSQSARAKLDEILASRYRSLHMLGNADERPVAPSVTAGFTEITEILVL